MLALALTSGQHVPGDGVSDGGEDPVELSQWGASVVQPAGDPAATQQMQRSPVSVQLCSRAAVQRCCEPATLATWL